MMHLPYGGQLPTGFIPYEFVFRVFVLLAFVSFYDCLSGFQLSFFPQFLFSPAWPFPTSRRSRYRQFISFWLFIFVMQRAISKLGKHFKYISEQQELFHFRVGHCCLACNILDKQSACLPQCDQRYAKLNWSCILNDILADFLKLSACCLHWNRYKIILVLQLLTFYDLSWDVDSLWWFRISWESSEFLILFPGSLQRFSKP